MIHRTVFDELKDQRIRVYVKDLPEPHCVQSGKIDNLTEHTLTLKDEEHNILIYIPLENISLVKTT